MENTAKKLANNSRMVNNAFIVSEGTTKLLACLDELDTVANKFSDILGADCEAPALEVDEYTGAWGAMYNLCVKLITSNVARNIDRHFTYLDPGMNTGEL